MKKSEITIGSKVKHIPSGDVIGSKKSFKISDDKIEVDDYCIMTNDFGDKYLVEVIKKLEKEEVVVRLELNNMKNICHQNQLQKVVK